MGNLPAAEEFEFKQLLAQIAQVERNLALPASREVSNALLTFLNSLKTRLGVLEEKHKAIEHEKQRTETINRVAVMVERETALSEREQEAYAGFLEQEYFTKADFSSLESFYVETWERLSEGGKAQMSHRVWEGVRREEYHFSELPETVKEKEAQRLRDALSAGHKNLEAIPDTDRGDFIRTWDAGQKTESYKVLDRPSFAKSVAVRAAEVPASVVTVDAVKKEAVKAKTDRDEKPAPTPEVSGTVEFKAADLAGITLTTADGQPPLSGMKKSGPTVQGH